MEEQNNKLKLQPLTPEAFKPYGQVLENRQPVLPEVEPGEGRVAIELLKFKRPTNARRISMMATHFSYNQTFIPLRGTMALVVAPPPASQTAQALPEASASTARRSGSGWLSARSG